jgi:hypothetical protein
MHRALHLGIKKALGVVASHYQVDFEAMSSGYVVPIGVEDEVAMDRADALAATAADISPRTSPSSCSQTLPRRVASSLKVVGRSCPHHLSISIWAVWPCNEQLLV